MTANVDPTWQLVDIDFTPETDTPDRQEWLANRRHSLGGSDAGAVLGVNPYRSPFQVYLEKTGQASPTEQNEPMLWGTVLEDTVASEFARRTGKKVHRVRQQVTHPDFSMLTANLDRRIVGARELLEVKTANAFVQKEWESEGPPLAYQAQVAHYLAVTGYEAAWLAVLFGGQRLRIFRVGRDEELIRFLVEKEVAFWRDHVVAGVAPDVGATDLEWLKERYPMVERPEPIDCTGDAAWEADLRAWAAYQQQKDEAEAELGRLKARMQMRIGEAAGAVVGANEVKWSQVSGRRSFDQKAFAAAHPELAKQFTKQGKPTRRFTVKIP